MYSNVITTNCLRLQAMATMDGNLEKATELQEQLDELEERAQELDRVRSSNISSISYINQRNRERNVREAEEAAAREQEEAAGAGADPFTRRKCQPTMVTKTTDDAVRQQRRERVEEIYRMDMPEDKRLWKVSVCVLTTDLLVESIETIILHVAGHAVLVEEGSEGGG